MKTLVRSAFVLVLAATAFAAHAGTIDFENLSNPTGGSGLNTQPNPVLSGGYSFTIGGTGSGSLVTVASDSIFQYYTGSVALTLNGVPGSIVVAPVGGGSFDFSSLQVANFSAFNTPATLTFTGQQAGGTVTQSYALSSTTAGVLQTVSLVGFTGLSSVSIGFSNYAQIDNLVVNPTPAATPEPSAFAALGLGAVALVRRRKRA